MLDIYLPFWGEPALLYAAVDSVLAQTSPNWRLTVVDDAYPDPCVAEYFAAITDPRVRYIRHEVNKGITGNYQFCIDQASADYLCIFGCDDLMLPNYVAVVLAAAAAEPQADIIQPGVQVINSSGQVVLPLADRARRIRAVPRRARPVVLGGQQLAASMLYGDWLYWPSLTFRAAAIRAVPFQADLPYTQDLALVVDMAAAGFTLRYEPTVCFSYRRHTASASARDLVDGRRLADERRYFRAAARQARQRRWYHAAFAATVYPKSRLLAATLIPQAVRNRNWSGTGKLLRHLWWR